MLSWLVFCSVLFYMCSVRALGTAIAALHHEHVKLSQRYIVLRNTAGVEGNSNSAALLHVTVADMEHMYLQVQAKVSLVKSAVSSGAGGEVVRSLVHEDGELVRGLCSQGNYYDAINLGISSASASSGGGGRDRVRKASHGEEGSPPACLREAISLLAQECAAAPPSSTSMETISQFASALGMNLTSLLEFEETLDAPQFLREYLVHCLQCLDGPSGNWSLHAAATAEALKASSKDALMPALVESFSGFSSSNASNYVLVPQSTGGNLSGNISAYLLQLLEKGYLLQACETATRLLDQSDPEEGHEECIPYSVLDRVIAACTQVIAVQSSSSGSSSSGGRHGGGVTTSAASVELAASHATLIASLENYFNKLLVIEAGGGH